MKKRLLFLGALGALSISAVLGYRHFFLSRPIGHGPAGPAVPREAFARPWTDRRVLLLGLGDSVTDGFGSTEGHSYFDRLVANPADEWDDMKGICLRAVIPNLEARNLAISGTTSLEHLEAIVKLEPQKPDVLGLVVITTGGNDLIHNYGRTPPREGAMYGATLEQARPWIEAFANRLDAMVAALESKFPGGCHILLANIFDPTDGEGDIENAGLPAWPDGPKLLAAYNAILRLCAKRHESVHLVDVHAALLGHGIHCLQKWRPHYDAKDPHYWYFDNLEDPNDRGYDAIRKVFLLEMVKILRP